MSHKVQWPPAPTSTTSTTTTTTPPPPPPPQQQPAVAPATLPAPARVHLVARDPNECLARFKVCEELRASPPTTTKAAAAAAVAAAAAAAAASTPLPFPPTTTSLLLSSSSSSSSATNTTTTTTATASLKEKTTPASASVSSSQLLSSPDSSSRNPLRSGFQIRPLPLFSKSALSSSALSPTSSTTTPSRSSSSSPPKDSSARTPDVVSLLPAAAAAAAPSVGGRKPTCSSSSASSTPLSASPLGVRGFGGSPDRDCLPSGFKVVGGVVGGGNSGRDLDPSFPDFTPTFRTSTSTPATPLHYSSSSTTNNNSSAPLFPDFSPAFKTPSVSDTTKLTPTPSASPFPSFLPSADDIAALASSLQKRQAAAKNGQTKPSPSSSPPASSSGATPGLLGSASESRLVVSSSPSPFCETAAGSERTLGAEPEVRTGRSQSKPGYSRMWEDPLGDRNAIPLYNRLHFSTVPRKTVTKKTWYLVHNTYASLQNNNGNGHPHHHQQQQQQQQNQQQQQSPPPPLQQQHQQQQQHPPPPQQHPNHTNNSTSTTNNHPPSALHHHHPLPLHHPHHHHPTVVHNALHHHHQHHANGARMEEAAGADEFRSHNHAERLMRKMETCASKWQLCDVVLVAGTKRLPCHRLVLAAASDYFAAMFTNNVREASMDEVELKDVDPEALASLVQYTYTGRIELKEETVECLLSTACLLQLSEVVEACCGFLMKQLHPSNCIGIRQFADAQGCTDLYKVANNYVMEMFVEVMHNSEFLMLPCDEVCKLLASDDLNVPNEETIFEALVKWAKHDLTVRRKYLPKLLAHIKLPLMAPQYIADHVETNCLFREERECQQLIMEALKYHLLPERRSSFQSPRTKPRKSTVGVLYAVGGIDCTKGATSIEKYELRTNTWTQVANMSGRRLQFGVAVLEDRLYVVGGRDGLKTLNTVECYDPKKKTWTLMPPMSTHRHGLGVGVLEGPMYAVGGHDGWSYLNTVERWDPQARQWSYVAPMSTARSTVGVASLHGKLYAVGGRDGSSCLKSVECFDPHTNKWTHCTPMAKRRGGVGVATCNGFLYAVGGHEAPATNPTCSRYDSAERYDPKTDQWTNISPISSPRDAVGLCPLGDKLFAVGGYDGQQYLNDVECYDPITNDWVKVSSLCTGRAGACIVHVPNS